MNKDTYVCDSCGSSVVCTVEKLIELDAPDGCNYSGTDDRKTNWMKVAEPPENQTEEKLTPCHICKKPRDDDYVDPCPHCGNDDPF